MPRQHHAQRARIVDAMILRDFFTPVDDYPRPCRPQRVVHTGTIFAATRGVIWFLLIKYIQERHSSVKEYVVFLRVAELFGCRCSVEICSGQERARAWSVLICAV